MNPTRKQQTKWEKKEIGSSRCSQGATKASRV